MKRCLGKVGSGPLVPSGGSQWRFEEELEAVPGQSSTMWRTASTGLGLRAPVGAVVEHRFGQTLGRSSVIGAKVS